MQKVMTQKEANIIKNTEQFRQLRKIYTDYNKDDIILVMLKQNETVVQLEGILRYQEQFITFCDDCMNPKDDCMCTVEKVEELITGIDATIPITRTDEEIKELEKNKRRLKRKLTVVKKKAKKAAELVEIEANQEKLEE